MKKIISLTTMFVFLLFPAEVGAVCPVCTVAVGAGLGVSRWIGIDDSVTGLWIGGLILSSALWLADWVKRRKWSVPYPGFLATFLMIIFVIPPLYWSDMIGLPGNSLWGIDKILLGIIVGSLVFYLGVIGDQWLRSINNGKVYVYYQKVLVPVFLLTLVSLFFFLITN